MEQQSNRRVRINLSQTRVIAANNMKEADE
jgi:hypothetical protein